MTLAATGTAGRAGNAAGALSGVLGRGRGGGITGACPGLRWPGIFRVAGTAARSAGNVHAAGGSRVRGAAGLAGDRAAGGALPPPLPAGVRLPGAGDGDGARPAEGDRQGPFLQRLHRDGLHRAVCRRAEHELPGDRPGEAGAEVSPATLAGTCAQAGALLAPLAEAITARSRGSWHLHAHETTWRVFAPREGDGPAKWWLWVFIGPDTVCFVMDPTRSGAVLARHAGINEDTGQLTADEDGGPRRLVISSDFYAVYQSAGKKPDGLVNLFCWAHVRRHFGRAGDANPAQLKYWTQAWLERIRDLYAAHEQLMAAWNDAAVPAPRDKTAAAVRLEEARAAWDTAITAIDQARKKQVTAPGLQEPARKALATLDREWDGLAAHRNYPMISLDNNTAETMIRGPVVTRNNAGGSRNGDTARNAAVIWTVTATAQMAALNVLTYLTAYLDACGRNGGKPLAARTWNASCPGRPAPKTSRPGHSHPSSQANPAPGNHHGTAHLNRPRRLLPCPLTGLPNTYP